MSLRNVTLFGSNLASVTDLKEFTPHSSCCSVISEAINLYNVLVRLQGSSLSPSLSPCLSSGNLSEGCWGNLRFRGQNQQPSSLGSSPALLGLVGWASTNTGRFQAGYSRCWQLPVGLRKTCYHSCYTDSVQESKRF